MTMLGADPDQLQSTAQRVLALADNYENANQQVGYWLRRMAWEGAEADRFNAMYQSQMHPQLIAAAAFLRQASSELRAQATDQIGASRNEDPVSWILGTPFPLPCGPGVPGSDGIGDRLKDMWNFGKDVLNVDTLITFSHYMFRHYKNYPKPLPGGGWLPYVVNKTDDLAGLVKHTGKHGSKLLGPVGIGISLWTLKSDVPEFFDDAGDLGDAIARGDQGEILESFEQLGYSYSSVLMGVGGVMLGASPLAGPAAPLVAGIGVGLFAGGVLIKAGTIAFDHLRGPVAEGLKEMHGFAQEALSEMKKMASEEFQPVIEELAEARSEIGREFREGVQEIRDADGFIETATETLEATLETGSEVLEGAGETLVQGTKTAWGLINRGGSGLRNPFNW